MSEEATSTVQDTNLDTDAVEELLLTPEEILFSSTNPNLPKGLKKCLESVDQPQSAKLAAFCYLYGLGTPVNVVRTFQLLQPHVEDPRAQALLAECYLFGKGVEADIERGASLLQAAQTANDAYAFLVAGDCHRLGQGIATTNDFAKASELYETAYRLVRDDDLDGQIMQGLLHLRRAKMASNLDAVLDILGDAAQTPFPPAWYELGLVLITYANGPEEVEEAIDELMHAAEARYLDACILLARLYGKFKAHYDYSPEMDLQLATKYYLYAAEQGNTELRDFIIHHKPKLRPVQDPELDSVIESLTTAADQNDVNAQINLGLCYECGFGVTKDSERAFGLISRAAATGDSFAEYRMGFYHYIGLGVPKDLGEGVSWYIKSADKGNLHALGILGMLYQDGAGVDCDPRKAIECYIAAATKGYPQAQHNLGWAFEEATMVKQEMQKAVFWYTQSAKAGSDLGQYCLARCYAGGRGVEKDEASAVYWYQRAAEQGHGGSLLKLAQCYELGTGVDADDTKAFELYVKATKTDPMTYRQAIQKLQDPKFAALREKPPAQ